MNRVYLVAVLLLVASFPFAQTWAEQKRAPETVLVTFQVQKGQEARLQQVLSKAWATYIRLGMVRRELERQQRAGQRRS